MAKRVKVAEIAARFLSVTEFTTGGTLTGITGPAQSLGLLPRAFRRLYRHHMTSGNYVILFTVLSGETPIGWVTLVTDPRTGAQTRQYVVPQWEAPRAIATARTALTAAV